MACEVGSHYVKGAGEKRPHNGDCYAALAEVEFNALSGSDWPRTDRYALLLKRSRTQETATVLSSQRIADLLRTPRELRMSVDKPDRVVPGRRMRKNHQIQGRLAGDMSGGHRLAEDCAAAADALAAAWLGDA